MNPYVTFDGNCAAALEYYAKVLGGEIVAMQKFRDIPDPSPFGPELADRVMHARLRLGNTLLLASDQGVPGQHEEPRSFNLQVGFDNVQEAGRAFEQLAEGGDHDAVRGDILGRRIWHMPGPFWHALDGELRQSSLRALIFWRSFCMTEAVP